MSNFIYRTLAVKIISDIQNPAKTKRGLAAMAASWTKAFAGAAVLGVVEKGLDFVTASVSENIDAIKEQEALWLKTKAALKATGAVSGQTARSIVALSSELEDLSGIDQEVIQNSENLLLNFDRVRGPAFDRATRDALDLSVAMGKSLPSAMLMVGKALQDPVRGLTALGRAGVVFTDKQKEVIKRLVETGQTGKAQNVIFRALEGRFKGAAAAAGDAAFGLSRIQQAWGDVVQGFIKGDPKAIRASFEKLGRLLDRAIFGQIGKRGNRYGGIIQTIQGLGKRLGPALIGALSLPPEAQATLDNLTGSFAAMVALVGSLQGALQKLQPVFQPIIDIGATLLTVTFLPIIAAMATFQGLITTITDLLNGDFDQALKDAQKTMQNLGDVISGAFSGALRMVVDIVQSIIDAWNAIDISFGGASFDLYNIPQDVADFLRIPANGKIVINPIDDLVPNIPNIREPDVQHWSGPNGSGGAGYRALGTYGAPPGWAWVGEQGPELRRLRPGDRILNASASARAMSGGNTLVVNNTIYAPTGDAAAIGQTIIRYIQAANRRNGRAWMTSPI